MQAVKDLIQTKVFDWHYAMWWIKASIQEYILRSWSLVKWVLQVPKKTFFNLRKAKNRIGVMEDGELHLTMLKALLKTSM